jgi:hypothetical protein
MTRIHQAGPAATSGDSRASELDDRSARSRALLACGVAAGPLFLTTVLIQAATRAGYDPRTHPLSLLSLGDLGWIQTVTFYTVGVLAAASAVGMRTVLGDTDAGRWGPRLIGAHGIAFVCAGILVTDAADGFPAAASHPSTTWHGLLHNAAATVAGLALDAACLVFARRFLRRHQRAWATYSLAAVALDILTAAIAANTHDFRWLLLGGAIIWTWASALAAHLMRKCPERA